MSIADATLRLVLLGDDVSASAALRRVGDNATVAQKRLALMSARMGKLGHTMSKAFTLPAIAVAVESAKMATDFSTAMTRIQTQAGGSAKDVKLLSAEVLALGGKVQQGPVELANSLYHLKSVGLDNAEAMKALVQASHLAAVGNANLEQTTNAVAGAWRTGIAGATNFKQAVSTLNAIVGAGNMTMTDLTDAMSTGFLPSAKTFGLSLHDVGAALALFTDEGVPANVAATRLRMSFSLLGAPSTKAATELASVGIKAKDLAVEMRTNGLVGAIGLLKDHLQGLSKVDQSQLLSRAFGGGRSGSAIMSLVNNFDVLQKKELQVTKGMSKFGADVAKQAQTPQAQFKTLISTLETLGVEIGDKLLPTFVKWAQDLNSFVGWFQSLPPGVQKLAGTFGILVAAMGPALIVTSKLINSYLVLSKTMGDTEKKAAAMRMGAAVAGMTALTVASQSSNQAVKALGDVAGGALMGFAAGGPIGAAIGAGVGLLGNLAQHIHSAAAAAKKSEADYSGLAGTLDTLTGATTAATRAYVYDQLQRAGTIAALAKYGIAGRTAVAAAMGQAKASKTVAAALQNEQGYYDQLSGKLAKLKAAQASAARGTTNSRAIGASTQAREKEIQALQAEVDAQKKVVDSIRNGVGAVNADVKAARARAMAAQDLTHKLKGIPAVARTQIMADGIVPTIKGIAALAKMYKLNPKQITTLIQAAGVDTTVKAVKKVEDGLTAVNRVKPNLSPYKAALQAQMDQAGGIAHSGGAAIGYAMTSGLDAALAADRASIAARSADLVSNAINAARKAAQAHSPSRKMIALGHDLVDGLMVGIKDRWQPLKDALVKIQQDVQNAAARLKTDIQARNQFAAGFQSFSSSAFGADYGTDANGNAIAPTGSSILAYAQSQRDQARRVKSDVAKLVKMGMSPALLRQLQGQGAAGIPELDALAASSRSTIHRYNQLTSQTSSALHGAGESAAGALYNSRVARDRHDLHLAKAIAKELAAELRRTPKDETLEIRDANGEWIIRAVKKRNKRKGVKTAGL